MLFEPAPGKPEFQDTRVIVEDAFSAIAVQKVATCVGILTQRPPPARTYRAIEGFKDVVLWGDNDRGGRALVQECTRVCSLVGVTPRVVRSDKDPKYYTKAEIHKFIVEAKTV